MDISKLTLYTNNRSKVYSDKLRVNLENVLKRVPTSSINNIIDSYTSERGINIRRIYRIDTPEIIFDDEAIRKLVTNLLSNAIKFTPDNGSITLYVSKLQDVQSMQEKLQYV